MKILSMPSIAPAVTNYVLTNVSNSSITVVKNGNTVYTGVPTNPSYSDEWISIAWDSGVPGIRIRATASGLYNGTARTAGDSLDVKAPNANWTLGYQCKY